MGHGPWDVQLRLQPGQSCWKNRYVYSHAPIMIHNDCTYINICIYMYKITLYSNDIPIKRISNIYEHPHDIQSIKIKLWLVLSLYIYMIILTIPMIFSLYIYTYIHIFILFVHYIFPSYPQGYRTISAEAPDRFLQNLLHHLRRTSSARKLRDNMV